MGTITGTIHWKSSLNAPKDADDLIRTIASSVANPSKTLTVFFLAEKHRSPFDVHRSTKIIEEFTQPQYHKSVTILVERALFDSYVSQPNVTSEGLSDLSSKSHARNQRAVNFLMEKLGSPPSGVVLIFFGEEHLLPIKDEIVRETPPSVNIHWIDSLSFDTTFDNLPFNEAARFDTSTMQPAGYLALDGALDAEYIKLLTKGQWGARFTVPLYPKQTASFMSTGKPLALYFKNSKQHEKVRQELESEGGIDITFQTFDGSSIAIAKPT